MILRTAAGDPWGGGVALVEAGLTNWTCRAAQSVVEAEADEFLVGHCDRWCSSLGAAQQHRLRAHGCNGASLQARRAVVGSCCPSCHVEFHSRLRLLRHLVHGARYCVEACTPGALPALAPELVAVADEADRLTRAANRRRGVRDVVGPRVRRLGQ